MIRRQGQPRKKNEERNEQFQSEFKGVQFPGDEIKCKDCLYRDRTTIETKNGPFECGYKKCYCDWYPTDNGEYGKPYEIKYMGADCEHYEKDDDD